MSKYNKSKYGIQRYGRYSMDIVHNIDLSQLTRYKLTALDNKGLRSQSIINQSVDIKNTASIRLRTDSGDWIYHQSIRIPGSFIRLRIKSVGMGDESLHIESSIGTIRSKGG